MRLRRLRCWIDLESGLISAGGIGIIISVGNNAEDGAVGITLDVGDCRAECPIVHTIAGSEIGNSDLIHWPLL